ncbi:ATP-dependent helicase [Bradyrhizobium stylosanthis]|uniref:DNA 3'-5' helicase n=1 Tax=Bradyrhizobium stylosanthis TaxID=1803665 RepID=A0A560CYW2_9BRAD|nr:ATP-dependent helicase [Bradyrhizobium stylosanthis]TWA90050.1 DNA helicase-2/ATP-dependent DNA helicase PcrA [Bradyrhizobium stylosanthis]
MSSRALYLRDADDLRRNAGQWEAYESRGHCVVLAGPGSGKTKTLTTKLARILHEDVRPPRGVACITFSNECAKELEIRLVRLGIDADERLFVGTIHSFSLTEIILPYAKIAKLGLPEDFKVATEREQALALKNAHRLVTGQQNHAQDLKYSLGRHRRSILDRDSSEWRTVSPEMSQLVEAYEAELRKMGLIDFDDMPLLAVSALKAHPWLRRAIVAKFPVLAVDEYQDLGLALHRMVMGLCFSAGSRLFAVGDADQSVYGFTGAHPELLQRVANRSDVQTVRLEFNYRCGSNIVVASEYALGEVRGYQCPESAHEGTIFFHALHGDYGQQANHLFSVVFPELRNRFDDFKLGDVAILYSAAWIGDAVAQAARDFGLGILRSDANAIYPRSSRIMRWLEACALWCCSGWRTGRPEFSKLTRDGARLFADGLSTPESRLGFQRQLIGSLWNRRERTASIHEWLTGLRAEVLEGLLSDNMATYEAETLHTFIDKCAPGKDLYAMTLEEFAGDGQHNERVTLSSLHSAKGREFRIVILFAMDAGRIPRNGASASEMREARRSFYVGFTRPQDELHIVHSASRPSPFVTEVRQRMGH